MEIMKPMAFRYNPALHSRILFKSAPRKGPGVPGVLLALESMCIAGDDIVRVTLPFSETSARRLRTPGIPRDCTRLAAGLANQLKNVAG